MINIIYGDITELENVDCIVNSAKTSLLVGGGVCGVIHSKAGRGLLSECMEIGKCNVGEAKITKGYNLKVPFVIHTVAPIHYNDKWAKEHNYDQAGLLKNCYLNSLILAKNNNLIKIAFSALSTGIYDYPINEATKIALDTAFKFININKEMEITFVLYTEELYLEYIKQIKNYNS